MVVQKNGELKITAEQLIDEAYKRGWEGACDAHDLYTREEVDAKYEEAYDNGYQRGLHDLHNALIAIDKWDNEHKNLIFHGSLGTANILKNHTSDYIVSEVRKWQQEQTRQAQAEPEQGMTIDEAIKHAEEVAEEHEKYCPTPEGIKDPHKECAIEHRQLSSWLRELKERRAKE